MDITITQINGIEFELLTTVSDILLKGNPETQIAMLFYIKGHDLKYVTYFIKKMKVSKKWNKKILDAYKKLLDKNVKWYELPDDAQNLGDSLRRTAFYAPRTKTYV